MEKIKAKVEQVLHKNDHNTTTHTGTTGTHTGTTGTHTGTHATGAGQTTGLTGTHKHSDPTGPHDSRTANKLDPRVDADQIGGHGNTASTGGPGHSTHTGTHTGTHAGGLMGNTYGSDPTGPHDSHLANRADPRVDSDHVGGYGNTTGAGGLTGNTHNAGLAGNTHTGTHAGGLTGNTYGSDPTGPHDSHLANKADPRVDSSHVGGYGNTTGAGGLTGNTHNAGLAGNTHTGTHTGGLTGNTHTGTHAGGLTGNTYGSDPTGPHDSHLANKADPRVDASHAGGYGNTVGAGGHGTHTGATGSHGLSGQGSHFPGPAPNTAGPHKSDLLNKADPRVDADLDGSKTIGGNKTYAH